MLVLVAVTDLEEADKVPNSTVEEPANSNGTAHWLAVRGLEAFAHEDEAVHLIYQDDDVGTFAVESALRVGMGTLEDVGADESTAVSVADENEEETEE